MLLYENFKKRFFFRSISNASTFEHASVGYWDYWKSLKQLEYISLSYNLINFIEKNAFSNLKKLKAIGLNHIQLKNVDREFIGVGNSVTKNYTKNTKNFN